MSECCAVCGGAVPEGRRARGPGEGWTCSMKCVREQSRALHRVRMREAQGQKALEVYG